MTKQNTCSNLGLIKEKLKKGITFTRIQSKEAEAPALKDEMNYFMIG